ncbi:MAG: hypothetical protein K6F81_04910 [Acholeplasmatales bacterium]|nr:hypothetical protein [Acholeplasmatales bacterium]
MKNYVTLVYLPDDEENANYVAEVLDQKHVEVHLFEKTEGKNKEILSDIKNSAGLIILHISEAFDYRDYLHEIVKANNRCQIIACYSAKETYQNKYPINEIELVEGYPIEALANDVCSIIVGGYMKVKVNAFNRKKYRKIAFQLFQNEEYVWSLCLLLKVFRIHDTEVKERIADAYQTIMDCDKAINYYSICLPISEQNNKGEVKIFGSTDEDSQGLICNNLGYLYTQTKNLEFAERYLKQAIALRNPDALYNLGYLYESSWAYDSKMRKTKEGYDIYCKVLSERYTSDASKERAREKLKIAADRLLKRKNYAAALQYYKAIGDGPRAAECIRNIKRIRQLYEERKSRQGGTTIKKPTATAQAKPVAKPAAPDTTKSAE